MTPLLNTADVMRVFGFKSRTTLYNAINRGEVPVPRKVASKNRWLPADIEKATKNLPQRLDEGPRRREKSS